MISQLSAPRSQRSRAIIRPETIPRLLLSQEDKIAKYIMDAKVEAPAVTATNPESTVFALLLALSFSHLLNDTVQSLVPAVYPVLKDKFSLDFTQIGLITLAFQMTASLLQPLIGLY